MELLRDRSPELEALGVRCYGISRDSPWSHVAWTQALDLTVPLLSDWNGDATTGFGVSLDYNGLQNVSSRSAFLVGQDGSVRGSWSYGTSELPDFDELLAAARAL
jgi:peroxiredoxin Q/BCP